MVQQGRTYHSFCPDCRRVIYNISTHGPMTPRDHNRTFCVCGDRKMTGMVKKEITIYGLEDILGVEGAARERERQRKERNDSRERATEQ